MPRSFSFFTIIGILATMQITPSFGMSNESLIRKLISEKQQKMKKLEKCAKKVKGFQIAGISTLGITAAGIVGNIALTKKNQQLDTQIDKTKSNIETKKAELAKKEKQIEIKKTGHESEKATCEKANNTKWEYNQCICTTVGEMWRNNQCVSSNQQIIDNCKDTTSLKSKATPISSSQWNDFLNDPDRINNLQCGTKYLLGTDEKNIYDMMAGVCGDNSHKGVLKSGQIYIGRDFFDNLVTSVLHTSISRDPDVLNCLRQNDELSAYVLQNAPKMMEVYCDCNTTTPVSPLLPSPQLTYTQIEIAEYIDILAEDEDIEEEIPNVRQNNTIETLPQKTIDSVSSSPENNTANTEESHSEHSIANYYRESKNTSPLNINNYY